MLNRGQFTFYRSFWEAIRVLPKKDRLPILEAIISYALDGAEPSQLTQSQLAFFSLVRPNLDTARRKAGGGSAKTSAEDNGKIPQRYRKDTANKKEGEKEKEKEIEIEGEKDKSSTPETSSPDGSKSSASASPPSGFDGQSFSQFWNAYPDGTGKISREATYAAWKTLAPSKETAAKILSALDAWKKSARWLDNGGAYVPSAANFLSKGYWKVNPPLASASRKDIPTGASGQLGEAELEAIQRVLSEEAAQ